MIDYILIYYSLLINYILICINHCYIQCHGSKFDQIRLISTPGVLNWRLELVPADHIQRQVVCRWWAEQYGTDLMMADAKTACAEVGV